MKNLISLLFLGFTVFFFIACEGKKKDAEEENAAENVVNKEPESQVYKIVPSATKIHWEGYKPALATTHKGTVNVSDGQFTMKEGKIVSGSITIDMATITDTDLEGEQKQKLEAHLKGSAPGKEDDFFNVSKYPTGKFEITNTTPIDNNPEANTMVYGNLTLRDITKPVSFPANINVQNGTLTATTPLFKIDRTEWDIKVLSKKFFPNLTDGFVDDQFGLRIEARAEVANNM